MNSMVLILVSIDRGGQYLYTGFRYRDIKLVFRIEIPGKELQQLPLRKGLTLKLNPWKAV